MTTSQQHREKNDTIRLQGRDDRVYSLGAETRHRAAQEAIGHCAILEISEKTDEKSRQTFTSSTSRLESKTDPADHQAEVECGINGFVRPCSEACQTETAASKISVSCNEVISEH